MSATPLKIHDNERDAAEESFPYFRIPAVPASNFHVQFGHASLRRLLYIKYTFPTSSFIIHQPEEGKKEKKKKTRPGYCLWFS